jgi:hypothetical protein
MHIAFYKGGATFFHKAVRFWTRGPYSHAELLVGENSYSSGYRDYGVRSKRITRDGEGRITVIDECPVSDWDIYEVEGFDEAKAVDWFLKNAGAPYDLLGLLGFMVRPVEDERNKWFCSESVAAALGFDEAWRLDPNTFATVLRAIGSKVE